MIARAAGISATTPAIAAIRPPRGVLGAVTYAASAPAPANVAPAASADVHGARGSVTRPDAHDRRGSAAGADVQAGAGVVADSDARAEHEECIAKARALFRAAEEAVRFAATNR